MKDSEIVKEIVLGTFSLDELRSRITQVFMGEIQAEIMKGTPVDTGKMRQRWHETQLGATQIEYSNNTFYLPFHIAGTGLYGPRNQRICAKGMSKRNPKHLHVMAWRPKGSGGGPPTIFRRCIKGMHPNPFIEIAMEKGIENGIQAVIGMFEGADHVIG